MSIDLSGGLDPGFEWFLTERPENEDMRDSATLWVMDERGALACPRITIDAIGADWERPWVQLNVALADGRTLRVWSQHMRHSQRGGTNSASSCGAGPLRFECVEPFRRWLVEFDGTAEQSTTAAQMRGSTTATNVPLAFRFEAEMAAVPWLMGMTFEAARTMQRSAAGALMGGIRYEQLCRIRGTLRVGTEEHTIAGTGMRVRRQGVRNMAAATGHCQHSALFPSGRAFGAIAFAPREDGSQVFNQGFALTADGRRMAARLLDAPWMTHLQASDDDASLVVETEAGRITIEGRTLLSTFDHHLFEMADTSILHTGAARYLWDGEETIGLIERCTMRDRIDTKGEER